MLSVMRKGLTGFRAGRLLRRSLCGRLRSGAVIVKRNEEETYRRRSIRRLPGGRPKGLPNKHSTQLKEMILGALEEACGVDYLLACANDEKTKGAFLAC